VTCSIGIDIAPNGFAIWVQHDPSITFVAPPSFSFVVRTPGGQAITSGGRATNDPGSAFVNTEGWPAGTYTINAESAGSVGVGSGCAVEVGGGGVPVSVGVGTTEFCASITVKTQDSD